MWGGVEGMSYWKCFWQRSYEVDSPSKFEKRPGIYAVFYLTGEISEDGKNFIKVIYIGKGKDIYDRWNNGYHHKTPDLQYLLNNGVQFCYRQMVGDDLVKFTDDQLYKMEDLLIKEVNPILNGATTYKPLWGDVPEYLKNIVKIVQENRRKENEKKLESAYKLADYYDDEEILYSEDAAIECKIDAILRKQNESIVNDWGMCLDIFTNGWADAEYLISYESESIRNNNRICSLRLMVDDALTELKVLADQMNFVYYGIKSIDDYVIDLASKQLHDLVMKRICV